MNYGTTLHGYAFQQVLHRLGVDSVIIDCFPKAVEGDNLKYLVLNKEKRRSVVKLVAVKLNWLIGFMPNIWRFKKFQKFIHRIIITTETKYDYESLLKTEKIDNLDIDTFVCESDVFGRLQEIIVLMRISFWVFLLHAMHEKWLMHRL